MLKIISNLGKQLSKEELRSIKGGIDSFPNVPSHICFDSQSDCHLAANSISLCCRPAYCNKNGDGGWEMHECLG